MPLRRCWLELLRGRRVWDLHAPGDDRFLATGGGDLVLLIGVGAAVDFPGEDDDAQLMFQAYERAGICGVGSQVTLPVRISPQVE
jgi:hypothetical protein